MKMGVPRKMKPMFGSIEDPVKQKSILAKRSSRLFELTHLMSEATLISQRQQAGNWKMMSI